MAGPGAVEQFLSLRDQPGLTQLGVDGAYTLFRVDSG